MKNGPLWRAADIISRINIILYLSGNKSFMNKAKKFYKCLFVFLFGSLLLYVRKGYQTERRFCHFEPDYRYFSWQILKIFFVTAVYGTNRCVNILRLKQLLGKIVHGIVGLEGTLSLKLTHLWWKYGKINHLLDKSKVG